MTSSVLISATRLTGIGDESDAAGWLRVDGGVVAEVGRGAPTRPADHELETVVPGFVDTHVHGAMGIDFGELGADPQPVLDYHASRGSTTLVGSIASAPLAVTLDRLRELAPLVRLGQLAGIHLEGPYLSLQRRGVHSADALRLPNLREISALLDAAGGAVVMVTLAPELAGAEAVIRMLVDAKVVVAIGHTDASADQVRRAIDAGATVATHVFNGMPPMHHRKGGPVGTLLTDDRVVVELIGDGYHLDSTTLRLVFAVAAGRIALVSDAMAATGLGDGIYRLAGSRVIVRDGVARLEDGSSLAGSTTPLSTVVSALLETGTVALLPLILACTATPATSLRLDAGTLQVGAHANLLEFDADGRIASVMRSGAWLA